jgi:hypothetical protein
MKQQTVNFLNQGIGHSNIQVQSQGEIFEVDLFWSKVRCSRLRSAVVVERNTKCHKS